MKLQFPLQDECNHLQGRDFMLSRRELLRTTPLLAGLGFHGQSAGSAGPYFAMDARLPAPGTCRSVREFGARGDGTSNDTPALQRALDAMESAGGGTLFFDDGRYLLADTYLQYGSNLKMVGSGNAVIVNGLSKKAHQMLMPKAKNVHNVTIASMIFDQRGDVYGNDGHSQCVSVDVANNVTLVDTEFRNVQTMAVWCETHGTETTHAIRIVRCRIRGSAAGGFSVFGNFRDSEIVGCDISDVQDDAIALQDVPDGSGYPANVRIVGNRIVNANRRDKYGSAAHGVLVFGSDDVCVVDNYISDTVASGIGVLRGFSRDSNRASVVRNTVRNAGLTKDDVTGVLGHGIYVHRSSVVTVVDNDIQSSRASGMAATFAKDLTLTNNTARANGGAGVRLDAVQDVTLLGNTLAGNGAKLEPYGILVISEGPTAPTRGIRAYDNKSTDKTGGPQQFGVYMVGNSDDVVMVGNDLRGNQKGSRGGLTPPGLKLMDNVEK